MTASPTKVDPRYLSPEKTPIIGFDTSPSATMAYKAELRASGVGMRLIVDVHQLADRSVRVFLRGGQRLVSEQLLNGAQIGSIGEEMRGEGVAQGVRMEIPIDVHQANVLLDDAANGTLAQAAPGVIEEDGFIVRGATHPACRLQYECERQKGRRES